MTLIRWHLSDLDQVALRPWSLTQAARTLGEPQHRLIYLCEKGVVRPDLEDAQGRGSSRRFSRRNLLEFAVALRLRDLQIPVSAVAALVYVLRVFEKGVKTELPTFALPESLQASGAPDLRIVIGDGRFLYITLGSGRGTPKVFGGIDLQLLRGGGRVLKGLERGLQLVKPLRGDSPGGSAGKFGGPERSRHSRVEVSVTHIARDLRLDA